MDPETTVQAAAAAAGEVAAVTVAEVAAGAEAAIQAAEARAEAAEAVRDAVTEAALRDELCGRMDDFEMECEQWHKESRADLESLRAEISSLRLEVTAMKETQASPQAALIATPVPAEPSLTLPGSPAEIPPESAGVIVTPAVASRGPIVAEPVVPAGRRKGRFL
jgi:hypothetical protein